MTRILVRLAVVFGLLLMAACVTQGQTHADGVRFTPGETRVALMPLDVSLFQLTAGGVLEPRADWTEQAEAHVAAAVMQVNSSRGLRLIDFDDSKLAPAEQVRMGQVIKLHRVVGGEILIQQRVPALRPPSKEGTFDWSIGPHARAVKAQTGADYGLFVYLKDSYSTGGRVALNIVTAVLFGTTVGGGQQIGYASLVNLETGQIVWFGSLARGAGDLRTPESAQEAVDSLFTTLPEG
ncbi:MAG: hypothetical protein ACMVY4_15760 [Minwuia sp.]|uniref:hypothetical protein n=1 Tax=Minwuia sp. TaxID=2493630 RepID=UPI003A89CC2A